MVKIENYIVSDHLMKIKTSYNSFFQASPSLCTAAELVELLKVRFLTIFHHLIFFGRPPEVSNRKGE